MPGERTVRPQASFGRCMNSRPTRMETCTPRRSSEGVRRNSRRGPERIRRISSGRSRSCRKPRPTEDTKMKRIVLLALASAVALPGIVRAQANANFSGTWMLSKIEPPPPPDGTGIGGGGDEGFWALAPTVVIAQTGRELTFPRGLLKTVYTLEGDTIFTPPGAWNALKTEAHWEGWS